MDPSVLVRKINHLRVGLPGGAEDSKVTLRLTPRDEISDYLSIRPDTQQQRCMYVCVCMVAYIYYLHILPDRTSF